MVIWEAISHISVFTCFPIGSTYSQVWWWNFTWLQKVIIVTNSTLSPMFQILKLQVSCNWNVNPLSLTGLTSVFIYPFEILIQQTTYVRSWAWGWHCFHRTCSLRWACRWQRQQLVVRTTLERYSRCFHLHPLWWNGIALKTKVHYRSELSLSWSILMKPTIVYSFLWHCIIHNNNIDYIFDKDNEVVVSYKAIICFHNNFMNYWTVQTILQDRPLSHSNNFPKFIDLKNCQYYLSNFSQCTYSLLLQSKSYKLAMTVSIIFV